MRVLVSSSSWSGRLMSIKLREAGFLVTTATTWEDFLDYLDLVGHAAILIETDLPTVSQAEALQTLRSRRPDAPIMAVNLMTDAIHCVGVLSAGADEILTPEMDSLELAARIRSVTARRFGHVSGILRLGALTVDTQQQQAFWGSAPISLSPSQFEILEHLALHANRTVSKQELIDLIYGVDDPADLRTIDVFAHYLRDRLALAGAPREIVKTVRGLGLCLSGTERRSVDRDALSAMPPWARNASPVEARMVH